MKKSSTNRCLSIWILCIASSCISVPTESMANKPAPDSVKSILQEKEEHFSFIQELSPGAACILEQSSGNIIVGPSPDQAGHLSVKVVAKGNNLAELQQLMASVKIETVEKSNEKFHFRAVHRNIEKKTAQMSLSVTFELQIPLGRNLVATTVSGNISVSNVASTGTYQLTSASGDVKVAQLTGPVQIATASGDIIAKSLNGSVMLTTASGDIHFDDMHPSDINGTAVTNTGDIHYSLPQGMFEKINDKALRLTTQSNHVLMLSTSYGSIRAEKRDDDQHAQR